MRTIIFLILSLLAFSCSSVQEEVEESKDSTDEHTPYDNSEYRLGRTQEQQAAFDALNRLQMSTDESNRLYSTFAGVSQFSFTADTSFLISQSELLIFMQQFVSKHCKSLTPIIQKKLAATSVLAQKEYKVLCCNNNSNFQTYKNGPPMIGVWVMPNILDSRDLLLFW